MGSEQDHNAIGPSCPYRPPKNPQPTATEDRHPFVAFKHFIDDQVSHIIGLATFSDIRKSMQRAREEHANRVVKEHFRWTGRDTTPDHDEMVVQRADADSKNEAFDATMMLVREAAKRHVRTDPARIRALYEDNEFTPFEHDRFAKPQLSFGGACYYMPETLDNTPSTAGLRGKFSSAPRFLSVDWFKRSCYSPINVEAELPEVPWREPFEDLLSFAMGTERQPPHGFHGLRPNFPNNVQHIPWGPGVDWMLSLYCRGLLPLPPKLHNSVMSNDVSTLEAVRQRWSSLAGSWAPETAEKDLAELVRAVASPPAPEYTDVDVRHSSNMEALDYQQYETSSSLKSLSVVPVLPKTTSTSFESFVELVRDGISPSSVAKDFWHAIHEEDANKAAEMIVRWEGKGRDVRELIDDEVIVEDYLDMETHPALWPLCEALEKAHSELLFEQAANLTDRAYLDAFHEYATAASLQEKIERAESIAAEKATLPHSERLQTTNEMGTLSALTTTQTTRMPDGSVTTKVVLKKRFADGREETTESVKVEHAALEIEGSKPAADKKSSWFWS